MSLWLTEGTELLDYRKRLNPWIKAFGAESDRKVLRRRSAGDGLLVDFRFPGDHGACACWRVRPSHQLLDRPRLGGSAEGHEWTRQAQQGDQGGLYADIERILRKAQGRRTLITPALWQQLSDTYRWQNDRLRETGWGRCEGLAFLRSVLQSNRPQYIDYERRFITETTSTAIAATGWMMIIDEPVCHGPHPASGSRLSAVQESDAQMKDWTRTADP